MATSSGGLWPGFELLTDHDGQWVHSYTPVADKKWTFVDAAGHGHFWRDGYPTLTWVVDATWMEEGVEMESGHYECPSCGEHIQPATKAPEPQWIAGPVTHTLTYGTRQFVFGPDQLDALHLAIAAAVASTLSAFEVDARGAS